MTWLDRAEHEYLVSNLYKLMREIAFLKSRQHINLFRDKDRIEELELQLAITESRLSGWCEENVSLKQLSRK